MNEGFYEWLFWIALFFSLVYYSLILICIVVIYNVPNKINYDFTNDRDKVKSNGDVVISVVVPVRNEKEHLTSFIASIENQKYSNFEVLCIDDHSDDGSFDMLKSWQNRSLKKVHVFKLTEGQEGKKNALAYGISNARGKIIVTTDADTVHHPDWLKVIASWFENEEEKVYLGPVRYFFISSQSNVLKLLYFYQYYENALLMLLTAVQVYLKKPFLANGANFAFSRSLYRRVGGYAGISHYASGDDMGLLYKFSQIKDVRIAFIWDERCVVTTYPVTSGYSWFRQRLRWIGKLKYYPFLHQVLHWLFLPIYHIVMVFLCIFKPYIGGMFLFGKSVFEGLIVWIGYKRLYRQRGHFGYLVVYVLTFTWLASLGMLVSYFIHSYEWKGRRVK